MFHFRVFTVCKDKINLYKKKYIVNLQFFGRNSNHGNDPWIYMTDHPDMTVSKFVENSIALKWDNLLAAYIKFKKHFLNSTTDTQS